MWYPELEIYGLERFGRQRVLKEMSGVRIKKDKTIHYELGYVNIRSLRSSYIYLSKASAYIRKKKVLVLKVVVKRCDAFCNSQEAKM